MDSIANKTSDQTEIILLGFQHPALRGECDNAVPTELLSCREDI